MTSAQAIEGAFRGDLQPCKPGETAGEGRKVLVIRIGEEVLRYSAPESADNCALGETLSLWVRKPVWIT